MFPGQIKMNNSTNAFWLTANSVRSTPVTIVTSPDVHWTLCSSKQGRAFVFSLGFTRPLWVRTTAERGACGCVKKAAGLICSLLPVYSGHSCVLTPTAAKHENRRAEKNWAGKNKTKSIKLHVLHFIVVFFCTNNFTKKNIKLSRTPRSRGYHMTGPVPHRGNAWLRKRETFSRLLGVILGSSVHSF